MAVRRSATAPRRSSRSAELQKKADQVAKQVEKKVKSTTSKAVRAVKPKVEDAKKQVKKAVKTTAKKVEQAASKSTDSKKVNKNNNNNKKSTTAATTKKTKSSSTPTVKAKAAPVQKRGAPKKREPLPSAEEKRAMKASAPPKKETTTATKASSTKKATGGGKGYKVGDVVDDITLKNDEDKDVTLESLYNESGLCILSYPKANTPGCTTQACNYRDLTSEIEELGYKVVGLSRDKPKQQANWKEKHSFKYTLLSDPEAELLSKLGATEAQKRCHWIIEKGGKLLEAKIGVKPADDAQNALDFIKSLDKKE